MKCMITMLIAVGLVLPQTARAADDDLFAMGIDALAVAEVDGSMSLRARKKLTKIAPDMVMLRLRAVDDATFPACVFTAQVTKTATCETKPHKLIGRGKVYRFRAALKMKDGQVDLSDEMTQNNLGACYYPPKTNLVVRVSDVDAKAKVFVVSEVYVRP